MRPPARPLPVEVIETEILPRLPVKSLVQFRSVCKLWKAIISDPDFVKSHLDCTSQNPNDENLLMLKRLHSVHKYNIYAYEASIISSFNFKETIFSDIVPVNLTEDTSLIGSVNGLVCLSFLNLFVIWNPATRQAKIIKAPIEGSMKFKFLGFGWDAVDNDYKVVMMSFYENETNYVYSCKSDRWTSLSNFSLDYPSDLCWLPSVIVKGEPYWTTTHSKLTYEERTTYVRTIVLPFKFEFGRNEFRFLPEFDCLSCKDGFVLVNVKECISALLYNIHSSESSVDLYCLDDSCGAWRKMYNVGTINSHVKELSHCFTYGGQIVFNIDDKVVRYKYGLESCVLLQTVQKVVCYDPKLNKTEGLGNKKGELIKGFSYKASLVHLQGMKPLHQVSLGR